jgi:hypothetical protein
MTLVGYEYVEYGRHEERSQDASNSLRQRLL